MKINNVIYSILIIIFSFSVSYSQKKIDPQKSKIRFTITNLKIEVEGLARGISGKIKFDQQHLDQSLFEVKIPAKSIRTGNRMRDEHLREEEFFHIKKYPDIEFISTKIIKDESELKVFGNLKIKGISKAVSFPFRIENEAFKGRLIINRNDFNVGGDGFLDTLGDSVTIDITCYVL